MSENKDERPISEKIEVALDEAVYKTQNAILGEREGLYQDVPATMEDPSGFRRVNRFATRRNLALKIIKNPKILLVALGVIVAVAVVAALLF